MASHEKLRRLPSADVLDFTKIIDPTSGEGLVPVIVLDEGIVGVAGILMVGFGNHAAVQKTLEEGKATFWSRARQELWSKGGTSGNYLSVIKACVDCDHDTVVLSVNPVGQTCHLGTRTCFVEPSPDSPNAHD